MKQHNTKRFVWKVRRPVTGQVNADGYEFHLVDKTKKFRLRVKAVLGTSPSCVTTHVKMGPADPRLRLHTSQRRQVRHLTSDAATRPATVA